MLYATLKTLHLLSIVLWVGGMAFAHFCLRPAVVALEPPIRLGLMHAVLGRFFAMVLVSAGIVLVSGIWMMVIFSDQAAAVPGTAVKMPVNWIVMASLGILMMAIFGHIRFVLFKRLRRAVLETKWTAGAAALASIRTWVRANLALGLLVVIVAAGFSS